MARLAKPALFGAARPPPDEPNPRPMRRLTILLFLCSCGLLGRPAEEQKKLTSHQYNAKLYFDNKQYSQALEQIAKGLAVEPDDYQLTLIKTHILLIQAQQTNDPIKLRDALAA